MKTENQLIQERNEIAEQPCASYSEIPKAVEAIKSGETKFLGALGLAVDLNEIGYDCEYTNGTITVAGYDTTNERGEVVRVDLSNE